MYGGNDIHLRNDPSPEQGIFVVVFQHFLFFWVILYLYVLGRHNEWRLNLKKLNKLIVPSYIENQVY